MPDDRPATAAPTPSAPSPPPAVLLVDGAGAAAVNSMSESHWRRLDAAGRTPRPIRLGRRLVRWRVADLAEWARLGCPSRSEFEALTAARRRA